MLSLSAQTISNGGRFSADYQLGCVPFTVHLTPQDTFGNITRVYTYENSLTEKADTFHTYTMPGVYTIVQSVGVDVSPKEDSIVIEVVESPEPSFQIFACEPNDIFVFVDDQYYDYFEISYDGNPTDTVPKGNAGISHSFANSGTHSVTVEGFFDNGAPNCNTATSFVSIAPLVNNAVINQIDYELICADNLTVTLDFTAAIGVRYSINKNEDNGLFEEVFSGGLTNSPLVLQNIAIDTNSTEVCFQIDALSPCSGAVISGTPFCQSISTESFSALSQAYATYITSDIQINFTQNSIGTYEALRQRENEGFLTIDTIFDGFIDRSVSPSRAYQYQLNFQDTCNSISESVLIAPPHLIDNALGPNRYELFWVAPENNITTPPLHRLVVRDLSDTTNTLVISNPASPQELGLEESYGRLQEIRLETVYSDLGINLLSNPIVKRYEYSVFVPSAFSPDGDDLNDVLEIFGPIESDFQMRIFNRWGKEVFRSTSATNFWDGTFEGEKAPEGGYVYTVDFSNRFGEKFKQQGSFALIRK